MLLKQALLIGLLDIDVTVRRRAAVSRSYGERFVGSRTEIGAVSMVAVELEECGTKEEFVG